MTGSGLGNSNAHPRGGERRGLKERALGALEGGRERNGRGVEKKGRERWGGQGRGREEGKRWG